MPSREELNQLYSDSHKLKQVIADNNALRKQLAQQAEMVEQCMVCMNDNADEAKRLESVIVELQAALAEPSEAVWLPSTEWTPCMKLPVVVHVRKQREGESHVSTREGITPVKPDDLIMRGVSGEEYPIGREIFEKTYRIGDTHPAPSKPEPDKDLIQALTERDEYHEMADKLAEGIALHFDGDIGEHSSSNSPWDRALDLLDSAACAETMRLSKQAALAEPSEAVAWTESAIDEYLSDYSLIGDDGDYTPTDDEKFVIKDAIIGFMSPTPETKNSPRIEDIQQAVARGWCSDRNLLKRMDSDLATDIADQVAALLFTHPASKPELPYDVVVGGNTFRKGVSLDTFVMAAKRWHKDAYPMTYELSQEQKDANLNALLLSVAQPSKPEPLTLGTIQRLWSAAGHKETLKGRVNAFARAVEAAVWEKMK